MREEVLHYCPIVDVTRYVLITDSHDSLFMVILFKVSYDTYPTSIKSYASYDYQSIYPHMSTTIYHQSDQRSSFYDCPSNRRDVFDDNPTVHDLRLMSAAVIVVI